MLSSLPDALNLDVIAFPDGGEILGVSLLPLDGVGLSDRLECSPLRLPTLAHECVHHLLATNTTALCHTGWYPVQAELIAWLGAGRLAVSAEQVAELEAGRLTARDLADDSGVPASFIELGAAAYARGQGDRSRLGPALARWCLEMQRLVRLL